MSASSPCPSTEHFRQGISLLQQQRRRELSSQRALDPFVGHKGTLGHTGPSTTIASSGRSCRVQGGAVMACCNCRRTSQYCCKHEDLPLADGQVYVVGSTNSSSTWYSSRTLLVS